MKFEIKKMIELSTIHISEKDSEYLLTVSEYPTGSIFPGSVYWYEEGYFVVLDECYQDHIDINECPITDEFKALIDKVLSQKVSFLRIDRDAEIYHDLKQFDW